MRLGLGPNVSVLVPPCWTTAETSVHVPTMSRAVCAFTLDAATEKKTADTAATDTMRRFMAFLQRWLPGARPRWALLQDLTNRVVGLERPTSVCVASPPSWHTPAWTGMSNCSI